MQKASILDLKLMQAFTRVSLARNPITSFIFWVRSLDLLQDFALTLYSETPYTKQSKGLQSGKLGSQTSSTHTSVRFSLSQSCIPLLSCAGLLSCLGISSYLSTYHPSIQSSHICPVHLDKFLKLFFSIVSSALFDVSVAHNLFTVRRL